MFAYFNNGCPWQIRSHAQKYFLKVQKKGKSEHVLPPRPNRKAAHPYPQKPAKSAAVLSQASGTFPSSTAPFEPKYLYGPHSSVEVGHPVSSEAVSSWSFSSVPPFSVSEETNDEAGLGKPAVAQKYCCSRSNEILPKTWQNSDIIDEGDQAKPMRVMPDFAQLYSFIGSVFDPNASGHLQRLKHMDPINLESRRLQALHEADVEKVKSGGAIPAV